MEGSSPSHVCIHTQHTADAGHTRPQTHGEYELSRESGRSQMRECPRPSLCGGPRGTLGRCGVCSSLTAAASTKSPAPWCFSRVSSMRLWEQKLGSKPHSQGLRQPRPTWGSVLLSQSL